jgi:hypothetical protein
MSNAERCNLLLYAKLHKFPNNARALWYQAILPQKSRTPPPVPTPLPFLESRRSEAQPVGVNSKTRRCLRTTRVSAAVFSAFRNRSFARLFQRSVPLTFVRKEAPLAAAADPPAPHRRETEYSKNRDVAFKFQVHLVAQIQDPKGAPTVLDASELWKTVATLQQNE